MICSYKKDILIPHSTLLRNKDEIASHFQPSHRGRNHLKHLSGYNGNFGFRLSLDKGEVPLLAAGFTFLHSTALIHSNVTIITTQRTSGAM